MIEEDMQKYFPSPAIWMGMPIMHNSWICFNELLKHHNVIEI